jgi:hypothetical protein
MKRYQAFGLSRLLKNFISRPHFISYHKRKRSWLVKIVEAMGAMRVVWTVRDNDDIAYLEKHNDTIIFEFYHPEIYF